VPYRTPDWQECVWIDDRDTLEALQESLEKKRRPLRDKIVQLLRARSRHLAERDRRRRGLRLVIDNTK
jgi:hypothetical protein